MLVNLHRTPVSIGLRAIDFILFVTVNSVFILIPEFDLTLILILTHVDSEMTQFGFEGTQFDSDLTQIDVGLTHIDFEECQLHSWIGVVSESF